MNPKVVISVDSKNKAVASITGMLTVGSKVDVEIANLGIEIPDWPTGASFSGKSLRLRIVDINGNDLARFPIASGDAWTVDSTTTPNTYKTNNGTATSPVFDMDTDKLRCAFRDIPYDGDLELGIIIDSAVDYAQYAIGKVKVRQWSESRESDPTVLPKWKDAITHLTGGSTGQVLTKTGNGDFEYSWGAGGGGGGTGNYNDLTNKPQIGGVTLQGNKTASDIGAEAAGSCVKKQGESSQSIEGQLSVGAVYVGGTRVEVVSSVPASPIAGTLYFVTGSAS